VVKKQRLREMAEKFQKHGLHRVIHQIGCQSRVDSLDSDSLDALRLMNVKRIGFGWESGSNRMLKYLKADSVTVADNKRSICTCRQAKFIPSGSVMIGSPTETATDMLATCWFILWATFNGAEDIQISESVPYPGTGFWSLALARGRVSADMNFDDLKFHTKLCGRALLVEIPVWQYRLLYLLAQLCSVPLKVIKTWECFAGWLSRKLKPCP
jgi:radical SAM superfamily enzyme YgiQ (UPF0313 family)